MFSIFKQLRRSKGNLLESGKGYYDKAFSSAQHWQEHYTRSSYYFLWTVIIDRLRRIGPSAILEIGCGPGQLAAAIHDAQLATCYSGIDFSEVAIGYARKACPSQCIFNIENALESDLYTTATYDIVISTEFLEHVNQDVEVLSKVRSGARVIATVPNFPYISHVRHFEDTEDVLSRYGPLFRDFSVAVIPGVQPGTRFYLMDGERH